MMKRTGVSRMAISKQVRRLRDLGYGIEASPRLGYRLTRRTHLPVADEILPALKTRIVGRSYTYLDSTDSTNSFVRDRINDLAEGTTVVADSQTAGRGRLQRQWFSPPGVNLYMSILLKPAVPPMLAPQLSLVAGAALLKAFHAHGLDDAVLKWPNDIVYKGRKLAGVLCEMEAETDVIHAVIIGIGVNVNIVGFPSELKKIATSIRRELGNPVSRPAIAREILNRLDHEYALWQDSGLRNIVPFINGHSQLSGQQIKVVLPRTTLHGTAQHINESGHLLMRKEDGSDIEISSGEVCLCRNENRTPGRNE